MRQIFTIGFHIMRFAVTGQWRLFGSVRMRGVASIKVGSILWLHGVYILHSHIVHFCVKRNLVSFDASNHLNLLLKHTLYAMVDRD